MRLCIKQPTENLNKSWWPSPYFHFLTCVIRVYQRCIFLQLTSSSFLGFIIEGNIKLSSMEHKHGPKYNKTWKKLQELGHCTKVNLINDFFINPLKVLSQGDEVQLESFLTSGHLRRAGKHRRGYAYFQANVRLRWVCPTLSSIFWTVDRSGHAIASALMWFRLLLKCSISLSW